MEDSEEEEIQNPRQQAILVVERLENALEATPASRENFIVATRQASPIPTPHAIRDREICSLLRRPEAV